MPGSDDFEDSENYEDTETFLVFFTGLWPIQGQLGLWEQNIGLGSEPSIFLKEILLVPLLLGYLDFQ